MRSIYNICFWIFYVLTAPYYFWRLRRRGNWRKDFSQRFGKYDPRFKQAITNRRVIWLHAVSVGETNVCVHLVNALIPALPNVKMVVSTTTTTGMAELQKRLPTTVSKIYYPIDGKRYVHRALSLIRPEAVILTESEIWPNFLWKARAFRTPLFLVNARLSDRSYPRYRRLGFLFRPLFGFFEGVGAQNQRDAGRLVAVGCRPDAVEVVGNLKFDAALTGERRRLEVQPLLQRFGVAADAPVLVAGSTHAGEEKLLGEMFLRLRERHPELFLVIVPRHFERARDVARDLRAAGVRSFYRSEMQADTRMPAGAVQCLLVNTTGELMSFYERATVVFVGKSLTAQGGQNPIEPAALGKPTVCGPEMQNFRDVVGMLTAADGLAQVPDAAAVERVLGEWLENPARAAEVGRNATRVVAENTGAIERTVKMILQRLEGADLYVAPR